MFLTDSLDNLGNFSVPSERILQLSVECEYLAFQERTQACTIRFVLALLAQITREHSMLTGTEFASKVLPTMQIGICTCHLSGVTR